VKWRLQLNRKITNRTSCCKNTICAMNAGYEAGYAKISVQRAVLLRQRAERIFGVIVTPLKRIERYYRDAMLYVHGTGT